MPSEPGWSGRCARMARPELVSLDGLRDAARAVGFHQRAAIRLLVVGHAHLEHLHLIPNSAPAKASDDPHWPAPVSVASFLMPACWLYQACGTAVLGLWLPAGRDALVLVVDLGRRAEGLFQTVRTDQRRRPPQLEDLAHRLGDRDLTLGGHLLHDQFHREQRRQVVRTDRLHRARVQHRRRRHGQVGGDVVPVLGHLALVEQELGLGTHGRGLLVVGRIGSAHARGLGVNPSLTVATSLQPFGGRACPTGADTQSARLRAGLPRSGRARSPGVWPLKGQGMTTRQLGLVCAWLSLLHAACVWRRTPMPRPVRARSQNPLRMIIEASKLKPRAKVIDAEPVVKVAPDKAAVRAAPAPVAATVVALHSARSAASMLPAATGRRAAAAASPLARCTRDRSPALAPPTSPRKPRRRCHRQPRDPTPAPQRTGPTRATTAAEPVRRKPVARRIDPACRALAEPTPGGRRDPRGTRSPRVRSPRSLRRRLPSPCN